MLLPAELHGKGLTADIVFQVTHNNISFFASSKGASSINK